MNRIHVTSSNLYSVGYDINTGTLEIKFNNGRIYQYYNVPYSTYYGLMHSYNQHGEYFSRYIRDNYDSIEL